MPKHIKYPDETIIAMRQRMWEGASEADVSREFHVSKEYVRLVKHNLIRGGLGIDVSRIRAKRIPRGAFERQQQIEACRLAGMSRRQTADHLGVTLGTVNYYGKGLRFSNGEKTRLTPELVDEVARLYFDDGWTEAQIAQHFHIRQDRISAILLRKETVRHIHAESAMLVRLSHRED